MLPLSPESGSYFAAHDTLRSTGPFNASEVLFHTGWFVESLATQTLVLFVIRTAGNPLRSRPSRPLTITTLLIVLVGIILPFTPLAGPVLPLPCGYDCDVFVAGRSRQAQVDATAPGLRQQRCLLSTGKAL